LLLGLSLIFLTLVIINGAFKYVINVVKGILGERMLRRMRYEMFALLLRFRPEDIRAVKPAEAASIIKDEVEPIGGFTGDAFIQPAFLGMQALTAMLFIMVQSIWLGMVALSVVLIQAFVIPKLRREQLRLTRERQIASRRLAGRIGEIIEAAPSIHVHGTGRFTESEIGRRLGDLFKIRVDLFRRKFAVKYLNNFLAQMTPFFFYAIGGYFALAGSLDIGQLVAVIAAYRDLPPPIKELIDWDQERADVTVKYQQIVAQFPTTRLLRDAPPEGEHTPGPSAPISLESLRLTDTRGTPLLESVSATIARPAHVALVGAAGSGRDILAKILGRQISNYQGKAQIDGMAVGELSDQTASRLLAYAGPDPLLFSGSIRDNVAISLRRIEPALAMASGDAVEQLRRLEAERSGNPVTLEGDDWIDLPAAGLTNRNQLDSDIMQLLGDVGLGTEVYRLGLLGRLDAAQEPETVQRFLDARQAIRQRFEGDSKLSRLITPFDPNACNLNATIAENLLFGLPTSERFAADRVALDSYARSILETEALLIPLTRIGLRMAETALEVFADLPPGHPLFERFSFIRKDELQDFSKLVEQTTMTGNLARLSPGGQARLVGLALSYVEPRHRLRLLDETLRERILRSRSSFKTFLPSALNQDVEFYDPSRYIGTASIRDNLLFGRVAFGVANAEQRVKDMLNATLREFDLERVVNRIGLDFDVGPGGKTLFAPQRASIALARCLIARSDILVMDSAMAAFGTAEARQILERIRARMRGKTLIVTLGDASEATDFDTILNFEGARYVPDASSTAGKADSRLPRPTEPLAPATTPP
jgi:putative ABC transport system ATP-binding protein